MTYQKTRFSYILWFLFAVLCAALLAVSGLIWIRSLSGAWGMIWTVTPRSFIGYPIGVRDGIWLAAGLLLIPAAFGLYLVIEKISGRIMRSVTWSKRTAAAAECIAVMLIMAGGLLVRIMCLNYISAQTAGEIGGAGIFPADGQAYYNRAAVTQGAPGALTDCGIGDLYVAVLSVTLSFLGNRAVSVVFLQIVLQMLSLLLIYAATRTLAGRLPACIASLYMAGSLTCLHMLVRPGPEWLFFVLYLIGLLAVGSYVKSYCTGRMPRAAAVPGAAAAGVLIGASAYLDLTAASLFLLVLSVAAGKKKGQDGKRTCASAGMSAAVILTAAVTGIAAWVGAAAGLTCAAEGELEAFGPVAARIGNMLRACYENSYFYTGRQPYTADSCLAGLLVFLALFLVFAFVRNGRAQNYTPWILLCLLAAPTPLAVYGPHGFGVLSLYVWAVLAGLGLQNCIFGGRAKAMQTAIEEINAAAEQKQTAEEAGQSAYIENPLPLPKKHLRRDMDYRYDVSEQDMKYDVEVAPDDDFDIR